MYKGRSYIIVGAGPIGSYLAQLLKAKGIDPILIEEHKELGRPIHCAGLVGKTVFEEARLKPSLECILNTINGAVIHLDNDKFEMRRKEVAYVIDRERFDKNLGKDLEIVFETRFLGLEKNQKGYLIETDKGDFFADIVIGADGAGSSVRTALLGRNNFSFLRGVQFRMRFQALYPDMVEVYIKKPYFYWVIPEGKGVVRVGVISQNPYRDLSAFIKEKKMGKEILEKFAGIVPLTYFNPIFREGIFLVGDSAGQVKPITYGGIYMGMRAAELLCDCLVEARPSDYSYLWQKRFGREISIGIRAREIFKKLSNKELKRIFSLVKERVKLIEEKADFERHSLLFWEILKSPHRAKEMVGVIFSILRASFKENL